MELEAVLWGSFSIWLGHFFCYFSFFQIFIFCVIGAHTFSWSPKLENRPKYHKNQWKILENHIKFVQTTTSDRITPIKPTHMRFYGGETTIIDRNTKITAENGRNTTFWPDEPVKLAILAVSKNGRKSALNRSKIIRFVIFWLPWQI